MSVGGFASKPVSSLDLKAARAIEDLLAPRVSAFYPLTVVVLGGIVGAVLGFLIGLLITEVIIGNPANGTAIDWQFWVDIVSLVLGALVGASLMRRLAERRIKVS